MSGLNGSGEMSLGNLKVEIAETNIASLYAQDIVNEVLQKALDIASEVHESKLLWSPVDENNACHSLIGEYVKKDFEIRDIKLEGTYRSGEIVDSFEMETEKAVADVTLAPCKDLPGRGGVGDQPITPRGNEVEPSDSPAPQEYTTVPVEKKSRVADLVKSSKQILSAYIMDEKSKRIRDKLEEEQEQFLQVIELDYVDGAEKTFKAYKKHDPTVVPLPSDEVESDGELLNIPPNDDMDSIDLKKDAKEQEEVAEPDVESSGKGDETNHAAVVEASDDIQKAESMTTNVQNVPSDSGSKVSESKDKKKKWNFGARLIEFLRRPKQKARGTQTVTRK